jgi:DNA-binding NtrC family response regulator
MIRMPKKTILIADDDLGYRFPIKNLFEDDFEVLEADNIEQMKALASSADSWIVDVRLPSEKMEGIEAVRQLWKGSKKPKVIFISVMPEWTAKRQLQALKDDSIPYQWLEKPFELELLFKIVKANLGD